MPIATLSNACAAALVGGFFCGATPEEAAKLLDFMTHQHQNWPVCKMEEFDWNDFAASRQVKVTGFHYCTGKPKAPSPCVGDAAECTPQY